MTVANAPKTPTKTFRCPDELWQRAKERAREEGLTVTDVLISALITFVEE